VPWCLSLFCLMLTLCCKAALSQFRWVLKASMEVVFLSPAKT